MISLTDVTLRRGTKQLFEHASVVISPGAKIGLVGRNGSGKSSLLDALLGELSVDTGDLRVPQKLATAVLRQEIPSTERTAIEYVKDGDAELRQIETDLTRTTDGNRLAHLHGAMDNIDGYSADARAAKLIVGLGFSPDEVERAVNEFSGGWRMRLNLAQALMCRSELLLLDEPTNHLDFEAVVWLEGWLRDYQGTLILISHDREFLDNVATRIIHLDGHALADYPGNYSDFERVRAERTAHRKIMQSRQEREIARISRFVERFRAKASKARQAQSRLKALERMERVSVAHADSTFDFSFPDFERIPDPLLSLNEVEASYGQGPAVFTDVHLTLNPGMRLGLLGYNGAGKSTLMRVLAGLHEPTFGQRIEHPGCRIGYFAQHQLELLDLAASPLLHLKRRHREDSEQRCRNFLGGFGFGSDSAGAQVSQFSGGEKARLVLAMLVRDAPNVLLLDEPTNHLDLDMRYALELALQDFEGALVLVSHDRHLLRTATDELVTVVDGRAVPYKGDLDDYERSLAGGKSVVSEPRTGSAPLRAASIASGARENGRGKARQDGQEERHEQRRQAAAARERKRPLSDRVKRIEKVMADLTTQRNVVDQALADPTLYEPENKPSLDEHLFDRARVSQRLDELELEWLELQESLESM